MAKKSSASAKHSHNGKSAAASTSTVVSSAKSTASSRPAVLAKPPAIPQATNTERPLGAQELRKMNAYWRAANYLSVGQIYLCGNPMLREPLALHNIKARLLGHWGTTPGQNFIYVHMNRAIKMRDLNMIYVAGPGHGGPAWSPTPISKELTAKFTRTFPEPKKATEIVQAVFVSRRNSQSRFAGVFRLDS